MLLYVYFNHFVINKYLWDVLLVVNEISIELLSVYYKLWALVAIKIKLVNATELKIYTFHK